MHFFSSQIAGELIFKRIEEVCKAYDGSQYNMVILYFLMLSLGFKGKYKDSPEKIDMYKFG